MSGDCTLIPDDDPELPDDIELEPVSSPLLISPPELDPVSLVPPVPWPLDVSPTD